MKPLSECRLYTFVDTAYFNGRSAVEIAEELCAGGSDIIQLRAKNSSIDEVRKMAESILPITRRAGVYFVVNDHLDITQEVGADICHLGQEDFFDAGFTHVNQLPKKQNSTTPSLRHSNPQIGLSTHASDQAQRAIDAGADYVAIGPVYATGTKPTAKPVTLEYVRWAAANVQIPWFAIGGINFETINHVLEAGARRICVVSAILNSADISRTCSEFRKRLDSAPFK